MPQHAAGVGVDLLDEGDAKSLELRLQEEQRVFLRREIGILLPKNQRQHRTLHILLDVLPCALC